MSDDQKTIGQRVSQIRSELGLNKSQFAAAISTPERKFEHSVISRYESDAYKPKLDFFVAVENAFGYKYDWISRGVGPKKEEGGVEDFNVKYLSKYEKPIYANVFCGSPASQWPSGEVKKHILTDIKDKTAFGLIANGDSMEPYINNGDILICVDNPALVKDRTAVVVVLKSTDEVVANAKYILFKPDEKKILLYSTNTKYEPVEYRESQILKIYKVVEIRRKVK